MNCSAGKARTASSIGMLVATVGPNMPRLPTPIPVALAMIACSKETLVPSANDVTMCGFCPQRAANSACVLGVR
jgi:hypothetical protein